MLKLAIAKKGSAEAKIESKNLMARMRTLAKNNKKWFIILALSLTSAAAAHRFATQTATGKATVVSLGKVGADARTRFTGMPATLSALATRAKKSAALWWSGPGKNTVKNTVQA